MLTGWVRRHLQLLPQLDEDVCAFLRCGDMMLSNQCSASHYCRFKKKSFGVVPARRNFYFPKYSVLFFFLMTLQQGGLSTTPPVSPRSSLQVRLEKLLFSGLACVFKITCPIIGSNTLCMHNDLFLCLHKQP